MQTRERNVAIDVFKGLLVIGMVLSHVLSFYGDGKSVFEGKIMLFINNITFSGFVFCYGYACWLSYFSKNMKEVYKRMLISGLKTLIAYYLSGIYISTITNQLHFTFPDILSVIIFQKLPIFSEFLIAFTLFIIIGLLLFHIFAIIAENKIIFWIIYTFFLSTSIFLYNGTKNTILSLFIGANGFYSFPVIQYMPFFLLGIYFARHKVKFNLFIFIGAFIGSAYTLFEFFTKNGFVPQRNPPALTWLSGSMFFLYLYYLASNFIASIKINTEIVQMPGRNVLFYLLVSNCIIVAFRKRVNNLFTCFIIAVVILSIIHFLILLTRRSGKALKPALNQNDLPD